MKDSETSLILPNLVYLSADKPSKRTHFQVSHSLRGKKTVFVIVVNRVSEVCRNDVLCSCKVNTPSVWGLYMLKHQKSRISQCEFCHSPAETLFKLCNKCKNRPHYVFVHFEAKQSFKKKRSYFTVMGINTLNTFEYRSK